MICDLSNELISAISNFYFDNAVKQKHITWKKNLLYLPPLLKEIFEWAEKKWSCSDGGTTIAGTKPTLERFHQNSTDLHFYLVKHFYKYGTGKRDVWSYLPGRIAICLIVWEEQKPE